MPTIGGNERPLPSVLRSNHKVRQRDSETVRQSDKIEREPSNSFFFEYVLQARNPLAIPRHITPRHFHSFVSNSTFGRYSINTTQPSDSWVMFILNSLTWIFYERQSLRERRKRTRKRDPERQRVRERQRLVCATASFLFFLSSPYHYAATLVKARWQRAA